MEVRVRFAPSPTGALHIGGVRTALYNYLLAKKFGGTMILRIEDTDRERFVPGSVDSLIRTLDWAGLDFDEGPGRRESVGPYVQSERLDIYQHHVKSLLDVRFLLTRHTSNHNTKGPHTPPYSRTKHTTASAPRQSLPRFNKLSLKLENPLAMMAAVDI